MSPNTVSEKKSRNDVLDLKVKILVKTNLLPLAQKAIMKKI